MKSSLSLQSILMPNEMELVAIQDNNELLNERVCRLMIACLLMAWITGSFNYFESINDGLFIENFPEGTAPDTRNILLDQPNVIVLCAAAMELADRLKQSARGSW